MDREESMRTKPRMKEREKRSKRGAKLRIVKEQTHKMIF
jgi:hypothetical protein